MGKARVLDAFIFYNELDLLEIRLAELSSAVDRFILVEAKRTFTGKPKPLYYAESTERFAPWREKIEHIVIDFPNELPTDAASAWTREHLQREALAQGYAGARPDELVIISDVDEIPRASSVEMCASSPARMRTLFCLEAKVFNYTLDLANPRIRWTLGPRVMPIGAISTLKAMRAYRIPYSRKLDKLGLDGFMHRLATRAAFRRSLRVECLKDAAWHFTYIGSHEEYAQKLKSFAHQELNSEETTSRAYYEERRGARRAANPGLDDPLVLVDPSYLPHYVQQNFGKFEALLSAETLVKLQSAGKADRAIATSRVP